MNVLLWRYWVPHYDPPATFSAVPRQSIGGTETQLLWHAKNLALLGHHVEVLGISPREVTEEGVRFLGAGDRGEQQALLRSGKVTEPHVILLEGNIQAVDLLREHFPRAAQVFVGHNLDRYSRGEEAALRRFGDVDLFGFVGPAQFAEFVVRFPRRSHKFVFLPNAVPWEWHYANVPKGPPTDTIVWVGHWKKLGFRAWARTMERALREHPSYRWLLLGPRYGSKDTLATNGPFHGLDLPWDRIETPHLGLLDFARTLSQARVVLSSLGRETGAMSAIDAHAMGRPVLSGNSLGYKWANPEGTGLRVTTDEERRAALDLLLRDHALGDRMGKLGQEVVLANYTERNQRVALQQILAFVESWGALGPLATPSPTTWVRERLHLFRYGVQHALAARRR